MSSTVEKNYIYLLLCGSFNLNDEQLDDLKNYVALISKSFKQTQKDNCFVSYFNYGDDLLKTVAHIAINVDLLNFKKGNIKTSSTWKKAIKIKRNH